MIKPKVRANAQDMIELTDLVALLGKRKPGATLPQGMTYDKLLKLQSNRAMLVYIEQLLVNERFWATVPEDFTVSGHRGGAIRCNRNAMRAQMRSLLAPYRIGRR